MRRPVTETDFRIPEFRDARVEDYEFRDDGKLVRKDRWEIGLRNIASALGLYREGFEIDEVVAKVRDMVREPRADDDILELRDALVGTETTTVSIGVELSMIITIELDDPSETPLTVIEQSIAENAMSMLRDDFMEYVDRVTLVEQRPA